MIAPQYFTKEQTPLKYYHFLRIVLILGVIARFAQGAQLLRSGSNAYSLTYAVVGLLLTIAAAVGLNSMKWYGVLALFGTWGLSILDSIGALVIIHKYQLTYPSASTAIGQIIGCGIVAVPSWIYFMKRRLLFSPLPKNAQPTQINAEPMQINAQPMQINAEYTVVPDSPHAESPAPAAPTYTQRPRFCKNCGSSLSEGCTYCTNCGTYVEKAPQTYL